MCIRDRLLDEGPFVDIFPGHADPRRGAEAAGIEQGTEVAQHLRAAAEHGAIACGIERCQAQVVCHPAAVQHLREAPTLVAAVERETVSYTHLRAHETPEHLVCRLLLE